MKIRMEIITTNSTTAIRDPSTTTSDYLCVGVCVGFVGNQLLRMGPRGGSRNNRTVWNWLQGEDNWIGQHKKKWWQGKADNWMVNIHPKFKIQNSKSKIQNSKSKIQNSKSKIQYPKFKIQNSKSKIQNSKFKIGDREKLTIGWSTSIQNSKFKIQNSKFKIQNPKSKIQNSKLVTGRSWQLDGQHPSKIKERV